MKRQASLMLILGVCLGVFCACSMDGRQDGPREWSPLTPSALIMEGEPSPMTEMPTDKKKTPDTIGNLPCGVSYTLYKDGELLLENGKLMEPLSDVPDFKNRSITRITFGDGVTEIGQETCKGMEKVQKVSFGQEVLSIGPRAFLDCGELMEIQFSSTLQNVGEMAFAGCAALRSIEWPESINASVGASAFSSCSGLMNL